MAMTVGDLAKLTGLTVRALHYYDEIGLCSPSQRTDAGYRLYSDDDVVRLQHVLVLRELGMGLDEIGRALAGDLDRDELIRRHRVALIEKRERLDRMLAALDRYERGEAPMDFKAMFDGFDPAEHEAEAKARWGNTDAYKESARRTKQYGKPEWEAIKREAAEIGTKLADLMRAGVPASDPRAAAVVAEHRAHITRWFYPCTLEMQRGLGEMYVADERFTANIDKGAPGLAMYWRDAIQAITVDG
jgi:DNA-binding transcriptional MerR regulator